MTTIISALVLILFIIVLRTIISWLHRCDNKRRADEFGKLFQQTGESVNKTIDKISADVDRKLGTALELYKTGPWYLVVFTTTSPCPIWISNNNIRSVHPDPQDCRLIIKQFNGEDMVIEDVENYDLQAGNEILDYDFQ